MHLQTFSFAQQTSLAAGITCNVTSVLAQVLEAVGV